MTATTPALSPWTRRAAWAGLILSALVAAGAGSGAMVLARLSELRDQPPPFTLGDPQLVARATEAEVRALESMKTPRAVILWALALSTAIAFIACGRLLRPAGVSRESMRRLASYTFLAAAVLRTLEGAQNMVVAKRVGAAMAEDPQFKSVGLPPEVLVFFTSAIAIGLTVFFAGSFAVLAQYFRSERVKAQTTSLDRLDSLE